MKLIFAASNNGSDMLIGCDDGLPWSHIKEDMKHFKDYTMNKTCVIGKRTFDTLPKNVQRCPNRKWVVVSSNVHSAYNTSNIDLLVDKLSKLPADTVVVGGKFIYELYMTNPTLLNLIDEFSMTVVDNAKINSVIHNPVYLNYDCFECLAISKVYNPISYLEVIDVCKIFVYRSEE